MRRDPAGGRLIRSASGWMAVKATRKTNVPIKSDERIFEEWNFFAQILAHANESFEKKYTLRADGMNFQHIAERVAELFDKPAEALWQEGRYRSLVAARSLLYFGIIRELGIGMTSMDRRLIISTVAVSKSVKRGAGIDKNKGYTIT